MVHGKVIELTLEPNIVQKAETKMNAVKMLDSVLSKNLMEWNQNKKLIYILIINY